MTFATEDTRTHFHLLPTQTQVEWLLIEELITEMGRLIEVMSVIGSQVIIRVYEKSNTIPLEP